MSSDPFNFGPPSGSAPPPQSPPPRGFGRQGFGGQPPQGQPPQGAAPQQQGFGGQSPFGDSGNPLSAPAPTNRPTDVFGSGDPAAAGQPALTIARPPAFLLLIALGVAVVAGVVALLLNNIVVAIICWFLAGPIAIGLVALFVIRDNWARASGAYSSPGWLKPLHIATVALCLLAILAPALRIADWVGHL
ncbi:hypothetical protein HJ590_01640 [Naumannella sp. ID2617S]|nr:hypothetical protein [Naumannella sp. ID2617S]